VAMSSVAERLIGHLCDVFDLEPTVVVTAGQWTAHLPAVESDHLAQRQSRF